jgi:hypothetical protein
VRGSARKGSLYSIAKIRTEGVYLLNNQNTFIKIDKEEEIKDRLKQAYNIALVSA